VTRPFLAASCLLALAACRSSGGARTTADPGEAQAIAAEAFAIGTPLVIRYGFLYARAVDTSDVRYAGPWNQLHLQPRPARLEEAVPPPDGLDTVSTLLPLDLRAEPVVLTLPPLDPGRYAWSQLVDLQSPASGSPGTRTSGYAPGSMLLAGPRWTGERPMGVKSVLRVRTDLALLVVRTQIAGGEDPGKVEGLLQRMSVKPLSAFLDAAAPAPAPAVSFVLPVAREEIDRSLRFFDVLSFALQFCPSLTSDRGLRTRFAKIGVVPGRPFNALGLSPEIREALLEGIADSWRNYQELRKVVESREISVADAAASLKKPLLLRLATGLRDPLDAASEVQTLPLEPYDWDGLPLDASQYNYVLHFDPDRLPPAQGFWSLTMIDQPSGRVVPNPLHRYVLQSTLPGLRPDPDGGITVRIQRESPGPDLELNWLPAPAGHFIVVLRLYGPGPEPAKGAWKLPYLEKMK
jgi:hypothetical protein